MAQQPRHRVHREFPEAERVVVECDLILQRRMNYVQQRCSVAMIWLTRRLAAWACLARSLRRWVACSQSHNSAFVHVRCGSNSRRTRVSCGRVIWGIFSPPFLLKPQQECAG